MSSGIQVNEKCFETFKDLKESKYKFVIYKINEASTEVVVDSTSADDATDADGKPIARKSDDYEEFTSRLPAKAGRFAVYDFEYEVEGGKRNKILFFAWAPDTAGVRSKMLYASTKTALRTKLVGVATDIQATDGDSLSHEEILSKLTTQF
ncbi:cofilin, partial [Coemansia helicoidea]